MKTDSKLDAFFKLSERGTTVKRELMAGLITFITMGYIFVTQPGAIIGFGATELVDCNGVLITAQSLVIVTAIISGLITLLMGLYANMPFALSTALGANFILGGMLQAQIISFAQVMTMTLVAGLVFLLMSIFGIRELVVKLLPKNLKAATTVLIGFFIIFLGMSNSGIADFSAGLALGDFKSPSVLLALIGLFVTAFFMAKQARGAILYGILITTIIGIPMGVTRIPENLVSLPDFSQVGSLLFQFDFNGIWNPEFLIVMFIVFCGDFFSTLGTVLAVGNKAHLVDEDGNLPDIGKPFLVDAIGSVSGAFLGCTTISTYVESTAGVEAGGRTGLTAVSTSVLFFLAVLIAPFCTIIPAVATAPALLFVGFSMFQGVKDIDFSDFTEAFPPFIMIIIGIFTSDIGAGLSSGILTYVIMKLLTGKAKEVSIGLYILAVPLILFFII